MSDAPTTPGWKLINMKVPLEALERIDAEAHRLQLTRTAYVIRRCDPKSKVGVAA